MTLLPIDIGIARLKLFNLKTFATKIVNLESILMAVKTTITGKLETKKT
jgi:hypothetical protein